VARGKYKRKRERKNLIIPISELGFSTRLTNILEKAGVHTLADLSALSSEQVKEIPGLGSASYTAVCEKLAERGKELRKI